MKLIKNSFILAILTVSIKCLNLKNHGIGINFYASSIAVFKNRAFLTLPRSSCYNNLTSPTLLEVHFDNQHQNLLPVRKSLLRNDEHQNWGKCEELQDAISVDVEPKKGRLWVLDRGTHKCLPKIVIYNLVTNTVIHQCKFDKISSKNVNSLVIDSFGDFGPRAYIGFSRESQIVVFSFNERKWWVVKISDHNGIEDFSSTERLAVSRISPVLYMTSDRSSELFFINLTEIRSGKLMTQGTEVGQLLWGVLKNLYLKNQKALAAFLKQIRDDRNWQCLLLQIWPETEAVFVGNKLGPSGGIVTDLAGGLNYYLAKDFAVLRWITSKPLKAEYHDVLSQSYETLPNVPHLFNGPQNGIWALVNPLPPQECYRPADRKQMHLPPQVPHLKKRIIKLSRFLRKSRGGNLCAYEKLH